MSEPEQSTLAEKMFAGSIARSLLEERLDDAGVEFDHIGFDYYDCSLELYGVAADFRLSADVQKVIYDAGFSQVYVNHVDKWETHYGWGRAGFVAANGWRVSYPHKRGEDEEGIWLEERVLSWPTDWFETGYCIIKPPKSTE